MVKCSDIAEYIEILAPCNLACEWDNVGLLVGDNDKEIKKVLIALDNDERVTDEAISISADMIITHHPIMFSPINRLTEDNHEQRMLRRMCESSICHYAAHTNMDCARGGLNDYLAEKLGIVDACVIDETSDGAGFGRMGNVEETTLSAMIELCEDKLSLDDVRYVGELDKPIRKVAVNSGSGSDILGKCASLGADLLITGDLKYTPAREAYDLGIAVIDAGHYGTEVIFTEFIKDYLEKKFTDVEFVVSTKHINVLKTHHK